jgi:hypothetical protein
MSGKLEVINRGKRNKIKLLQQNRDAAIAAKKAKLSQDVIPSTPDTTVQLVPKLFCSLCSCQDIIDSNQLYIKQWEFPDQVSIGRDSRRDRDYQYVLSMLPNEMVHVIAHRLSMELRNGIENITIQQPV